MNFQILIKQIQSVQSALQSTAAHTINVALTVRNWLIGYYIVEFEQHGEDRATYGQKLLKNLEKTLKTKGMTERRFREFRRLYQIFPQIAEEITNVLPPDTIRQMVSGEFDSEIRRTLSGESNLPIRRTSGEFQLIKNKQNTIDIPAKLLLTKLPYSHLDKMAITNAIQNKAESLMSNSAGQRPVYETALWSLSRSRNSQIFVTGYFPRLPRCDRGAVERKY